MCHKVSLFIVNKLNKFIRVHKDSLPFESTSNVVYKINCGDYDASYVGQTGRKLKTRISEHRKHITSITSSKSVITDPRLHWRILFAYSSDCTHHSYQLMPSHFSLLYQ
ncbi:hypothetical protein ALC57_10579 [Trachymyrmex cornetzi]|uniref:GIY-YIG domain-containing protein n=1 Tax=Trachymyrmex cornetzi TaxID=471704 RepID=A0A151J4B3_9HYME|nr:hypothetical protein ALC57_10579 [Trachymyrmex cornetzi]